eukprot:Gb_19660 [translate_table: standard]
MPFPSLFVRPTPSPSGHFTALKSCQTEIEQNGSFAAPRQVIKMVQLHICHSCADPASSSCLQLHSPQLVQVRTADNPHEILQFSVENIGRARRNISDAGNHTYEALAMLSAGLAPLLFLFIFFFSILPASPLR